MVLKHLAALYTEKRSRELCVHTLLQVNVFLQLTVKPAIMREVRDWEKWNKYWNCRVKRSTKN